MLVQRRSLILLPFLASVSAGTALMDASGTLRLQTIPNVPSQGVVSVVVSPGTPSLLLPEDTTTTEEEILSLDSEASPPRLVCRGATLSGTSVPERNSLATCSLVAGAMVIDGITVGDCQAGLRNSRHARTLTALFRARVKLEQEEEQSPTKQTLILAITGDTAFIDQEGLETEVQSLYKAAAVEKKGAPSFQDMYDLQVISVASAGDYQKVLSAASVAAQTVQKESQQSLSSALSNAHNKVRESGVGAVALDPPYIAHAFVAVGNSYVKQSRAARARIAAWRSRASRGLVVDGFGRDAEHLRKRVLGTFDSETLIAAGLPLVASYRQEMRSHLQSLVDSAIEEVFEAQVANLEKSTLKRFNAQLLRTLDDPADLADDANAAFVAAFLRKETFTFETLMEDLEVLALGLTKAKAARQMSSKLNDALAAFPDSPSAKIKRTQGVKKVVSKERKPSQRAIDFGIDLVAMLRPDGFGSFQGFAGYQFGGNSLTFGVHNDADDPQVIAQFGGVRPPLLRVQPKLRVDVEL